MGKKKRVQAIRAVKPLQLAGMRDEVLDLVAEFVDTLPTHQAYGLVSELADDLVFRAAEFESYYGRKLTRKGA